MTDATLLAWLAGSLEPGAARDVEDAMWARPELVRRAEALRHHVEPPEPARWAIPPPRIWGGRRPFRLSESTMAMDDTPRAGEGHALRLPDRSDERIVLLLDVGSGWEVLLPTAPEDEVRLTELPLRDGERVLDVVLPEDANQRWAIALLPEDVPIAWERPDPWTALRRGLVTGHVPVTSVEIRLS